MKYRTLGKDVGWHQEERPKGAIRAAIDHGINLIDTAPMYGYAEQLVGGPLRGLGDKVVLAKSAACEQSQQEHS